MSKVINKNRIKIYDGTVLIEDRNTTLEDLIDVLLDKLENKYVIEGSLTIGNQTYKFTLRFKKVSG